MTPVSPSRLAVDALGLQPLGEPAATRLRCCMCGFDIQPGELHTRAEFGRQFMDGPALAARTGVVCGYCEVAKSGEGIMKMQKAVFCREGAFSLAKDVHRAWFLLTPPEPPFVAVVSDAMQQHLVWRTPVSWSKDLYVVRLGQRLLRIRRPVLLQAIEAAQKVMADAGDKVHKARHPFASLDREMGSLDHGAIRSDFVGKVPEILLTLRPGELWAMATLAKQATPIPERPEPMPKGSMADAGTNTTGEE